MLGTWLALLSSQPKIGARRAELWTLIGLAMIMASIVSLDEDQNVPGLLALPARLETALLIGVGPEQRPTVTRLLSARPVVALAWYFSLPGIGQYLLLLDTIWTGRSGGTS